MAERPSHADAAPKFSECERCGWMHTAEAPCLVTWKERAQLAERENGRLRSALVGIHAGLEAAERQAETDGYREVGRLVYAQRLRVSELLRALERGEEP